MIYTADGTLHTRVFTHLIEASVHFPNLTTNLCGLQIIKHSWSSITSPCYHQNERKKRRGWEGYNTPTIGV